jgi:hypothetical protein
LSTASVELMSRESSMGQEKGGGVGWRGGRTEQRLAGGLSSVEWDGMGRFVASLPPNLNSEGRLARTRLALQRARDLLWEWDRSGKWLSTPHLAQQAWWAVDSWKFGLRPYWPSLQGVRSPWRGFCRGWVPRRPWAGIGPARARARGGAAGIAPLPTASFHSLPLAALLVIPNLAVPRTPRCSRLVRTAPLDAARPGESSASRGSDAGLPCFWKICALCSVLRRDETSNGAAASGAGALSLLSAMASLRMLQI